jgi:hypothetical protein
MHGTGCIDTCSRVARVRATLRGARRTVGAAPARKAPRPGRDPIRSIVLAIISIVLALQAGYLGGVITRIIIASIDIRKSGTKNWAFPSAHPQR